MPNFRGGLLSQGQPLGNVSQTMTLTADNQVINPSGYWSMINLESDSTTASQRTFTILGSTLDGQALILMFTSGSSTTAELADSGNCLLSAAWTPTQGDVLTLVWNSRLAKWVETARVDN